MRLAPRRVSFTDIYASERFLLARRSAAFGYPENTVKGRVPLMWLFGNGSVGSINHPVVCHCPFQGQALYCQFDLLSVTCFQVVSVFAGTPAWFFISCDVALLNTAFS